MSTPDAPQTPDDSFVRLDARSLKVLAHPMRSRLLGALRGAGPSTATSLAARLQTNSGATSYHLRKLAEVGVVEDNGEGTGRARIWTASTSGRPRGEDAAEDAGQDGDDDAAAALAWLARDYLHHFTDRA